MWFKYLLLSSTLLGLVQGLAAFGAMKDAQSARSLSQSASATTLDQTPTPTVQGAILNAPQAISLRDPLLSNLLLPLPPLLLPSLLFPHYSFPSFNSQRLDQELQLYSRYIQVHGVPDVLIVGSSRSLQGIDPAALEQALADQGYGDVTVYNFGINGATAKVISLLLQQVLAREQMPRLLIWGDGSRAFNSGRLDITYNGIVASDGYKSLMAGRDPIPTRIFAWQMPSLRTALSRTLSSTSTTLASAAPGPPHVVADIAQIAPDLTAQGFNALTARYDPTTYYQRYPRVPGRYDSNYQNFTLWGEQADATMAIATFARNQSIPLAFVNLPLTQDYVTDTLRNQYEQRFREHMQQLATRQQFVFRDYSQHPNLIDNNYFVDPSHINQDGARAVAIQLASDTAIPWDVLKQP